MKGSSVNPVSESPGSTSTTLLARLKARDQEAWRRLAKLYGPLIYGWCRRRGLQGEDAADIVQEVFRAVAGNIQNFTATPDGSFRGWLWTITRSRLLDFFRRRQSRPQAAGGSDAQGRLLQVPEPLDDSSAAPAMGGLVGRALDLIRPEFKEESWQAFWHVVVDGQHTGEVAKNLGLSVNAVYIAKCRILCRLREELGEA